MSSTSFLIEEPEVQPQEFWMSVPRPDKNGLGLMEEYDLFFTPRVLVSGEILVYMTVDILYEDKNGNFSSRRITVKDYYSDTDSIEAHCHLKNDRRRFLISGLRNVRLVSGEYLNTNGCEMGWIDREQFKVLCETGEVPPRT